MSVVPYISLFIGICTPLLGIAFGITWVDLHHQLKKSPRLQAEFKAAGKQLRWTILFAALNLGPSYIERVLAAANLIPPSYLVLALARDNQFQELIIVASGAAFLWSLILFSSALINLIIEAKQETAKTRT